MNKARVINPNNDKAWLYMALHSALHSDDTKSTLEFVEKSLDLNKKNLAFFESHEAFKALRALKDYKKLLTKYQESIAKEQLESLTTR